MIKTPKSFPYRPLTEKGLTLTIAMVRIARLSNAIAFCISTADEAHAFPAPVHKRQITRALFLMGGYLYEAEKLIVHMRKAYHGVECFDPLDTFMELVEGPYACDREILEEMNFHVAFHSDWNDTSTPAIVANVGLPNGASPKDEGGPDHDTSYFTFVDAMDTEYLIRRLFGRVSRGDIVRFMKADLRRMCVAFVVAADEFVKGISELIAEEESSVRKRSRNH
jgi:hypothetical protein